MSRVTEAFRSKENFRAEDEWLNPAPPDVAAVLTSVAPATSTGGQLNTYTLTGTGFTPTSRGRVGSTDQNTTYVSPTELTVSYAPGQATFTINWSVMNGEAQSNVVTSQVTYP